MMWWTPTTKREAIAGLTTLLRRQEWVAAEGDSLRSILRPYLDGPDGVCRWLTAGVIHLLVPDPISALDLIRSRLREESVFEVGGALTRQLGRFVCECPDLVDKALHEASFAPWLTVCEEEDPRFDYLFVDDFVWLTLYMALVEETPHACALTESWFNEHLTSVMCERAITLIRSYLVDPADDVRARAFGLLGSAVDAVERTRLKTDSGSPLFQKANLVTEAVVTSVCLAGTSVSGNERPGRLPSGFCACTLDVLERISVFHNDEMVHDIVQALERLAPEEPSAVLLSLIGVIDKGDPSSALFHFPAKEEIANLCARYLSEFWEHIRGEEQYLTALRRILGVLVQAGWPSAIELSQRLGDAFR